MRRARIVATSQNAATAIASTIAIVAAAIQSAPSGESALAPEPWDAPGLSCFPGEVAPVSCELPVAALVAALPLACEEAGDADGVGSKGTQPIPLNQTSTQEWASKSRTRYSWLVGS